MKRFFSGITCAVLLFASTSFAIGLQHGVFRSQSTQGAAWQGTAVIDSERFDITVYPDYLDVNLEWVFKIGGTPPDSFRNALEIVGNLNLDAHSSVVGLITWYKGLILKGKLKSDSVARQQYEQVVDRSSTAPPPPRDPVLFEYGWGDDNYYISIFPAAFDSTRKVRIRYLVPAFKIDGVNKIAYPYSFTANPTVTIQPGSGVIGYIVEAAQSKRLFDNPLPVALDAGTYSFQAYGGRTNCQTISYIIPVLYGTPEGSVMYCGSFSTPSFSGEMCHVAVMTAQQALASSSVKEDFVVLWRWNHPDILARYARQIVEQSFLLKKFLFALDATNKRAALIISQEGKAPVTFHLDKQGGGEFKRMLAYLDSLSSLPVIDPPMGPYKQSAITVDAAQATKEFNDAIQTALDLFERDAVALKHLLILTAGPQLVSVNVNSSAPPFAWDSTINVDMLSSYLNGRVLGSSVTLPLDQAYWPGGNLSGFMQKYHTTLNAWATVGNGVDTANIKVLASPVAGSANCTWQQTTDMHLYSSQPLVKQIKWTIANGAAPVISFTESPTMVWMSDSMQYGRLIGSSCYLVPMAANMPTSIASTLGFVDKKYSLVALEEDALPTAVAQTYDAQGVPELTPEDIFAAPGEHMEPVKDWLAAYPPKSMSRTISLPTSYYPLHYLEDFAGRAVINNAEAFRVVPAAINANAVRVLPAADVVNSLSSQTYPDYTTAVAGKKEVKPAASLAADMLFVKNGRLRINPEKVSGANGKSINITLYTCSGKKIGLWNFTASKLSKAPIIAKLGQGAYIARITCGTAIMVQRIIVR